MTCKIGETAATVVFFSYLVVFILKKEGTLKSACTHTHTHKPLTKYVIMYDLMNIQWSYCSIYVWPIIWVWVWINCVYVRRPLVDKLDLGVQYFEMRIRMKWCRVMWVLFKYKITFTILLSLIVYTIVKGANDLWMSILIFSYNIYTDIRSIKFYGLNNYACVMFYVIRFVIAFDLVHIFFVYRREYVKNRNTENYKHVIIIWGRGRLIEETNKWQ